MGDGWASVKKLRCVWMGKRLDEVKFTFCSFLFALTWVSVGRSTSLLFAHFSLMISPESGSVSESAKSVMDSTDRLIRNPVSMTDSF